MPLLTVAGVALLVGATLAGAALSRSTRIPPQWMDWAAALVMAVLVLDLLPEIWSGSGFVAMAGGFALASLLRVVSFGSAAAAISAHRFVEGALLALVISPTAVAAFVTHSLAEGFAVGATLRTAPQRTAWTWLAATCLAPVTGAMLMPSGASQPLLMAVAAGAIARSALPPKAQPPESSSSAPSGTRSDSRSSSHP